MPPQKGQVLSFMAFRRPRSSSGSMRGKGSIGFEFGSIRILRILLSIGGMAINLRPNACRPSDRSGAVGSACVRLDAENGSAAQAVCGEAGVIWDAGTAIRAGGMSVFRHDGRRRTGDICRKQLVATALAHWVEIVFAGLLQDVLKGTRRGTRFGFLLQNLSKLKSIAIGNIDSRQLTHIGSPIFFRGRKIRRYAQRGGLYGVPKTIVCREGEKGVWGGMEFNRVRRAEHAGNYMTRGLRRRLPLRHVSHKGRKGVKQMGCRESGRPDPRNRIDQIRGRRRRSPFASQGQRSRAIAAA